MQLGVCLLHRLLEKRVRFTFRCFQEQLQSASIGLGVEAHTLGQGQIIGKDHRDILYRGYLSEHSECRSTSYYTVVKVFFSIILLSSILNTVGQCGKIASSTADHAARTG